MTSPPGNEGDGSWNGSHSLGLEVDDAFRMAKVFFHAATKLSENNEDILPQEDGEDMKLSVFSVFASLFPDTVGSSGGGVKNKRMRLHFNKIGYQIYGKEQSRRVPSLRAKPGNPGYGFRRARWRDAVSDSEDRSHCQTVLRAAGCSEDKIEQVMVSVQECRHMWDAVRRPSRPAGPGRPRRAEGSPFNGSMKSPAKTKSPNVSAAPHGVASDPESKDPLTGPSEGEESRISSHGHGADGGPPPLVAEHLDILSPGTKRLREEPLTSMMLTLKKKAAQTPNGGPPPLVAEHLDILSPRGFRLREEPLTSMMLTLKKKAAQTPTMNRMGEGKSMIRDLCLPPLSLPPMARLPSIHPRGSLEAEMARSPAERDLKLSCGPPSLSALEFLAHAAAAASEDQRQLIPIAAILQQ
eukprot:CAMPEP_0202853944 /NCGR_PEP_ID=MMETSP1389-20130828/90744_1 /ASSEMBLY_ACC=CAM_ASM_000865 /TAXON_ID=302021 /ORGANISM="Rhodomonas sp., Strain CCMP768" /LENGTH=409 /DNA_ID=CAMNT_0049532513 /DNA_START=188 /DNA_END=1417 /DNA_ORIENTATION=-